MNMQKGSKTMARKLMATAKAAEGFTTGIVDSWEVKNVKAFDWGITFTLVLNGVEIHGVKVGVRKDGNSFISMPSYKGKDGKYYSHVYFRFADDDQDKILDAVAAAIAHE